MKSEDGSMYFATEQITRIETLLAEMQFDRPVSRSADEMTFAKDNWLVRVPIERIIYCEWDGTGGRNYFGREIP